MPFCARHESERSMPPVVVLPVTVQPAPAPALKRPWNVLVIDGGGIRGVIPAKILTSLEQKLQGKKVKIFFFFIGWKKNLFLFVNAC